MRRALTDGVPSVGYRPFRAERSRRVLVLLAVGDHGEVVDKLRGEGPVVVSDVAIGFDYDGRTLYSRVITNRGLLAGVRLEDVKRLSPERLWIFVVLSVLAHLA